jgi:hypothetical protein
MTASRSALQAPEAIRCLNMEHLKEHKKEALRAAA